jgi:hypothetical protein
VYEVRFAGRKELNWGLETARLETATTTAYLRESYSEAVAK